ncbi:MAG: ABC transporter ATP-binding protein [Ancalomicrobiaceae bacterium]|nr:ABC transporter ATP-binding protein [Ancalomicrobiaceae bacterium]
MNAATPMPREGTAIVSPAAGAPTVTLSGISRRYGRQLAVDGVDLTLLPGECVGLVGHNGAGKSTLIKLMLGLVAPTAGRIRVLGAEPGSRAAALARAEIGYLPENVALSPSLTGAETLAFYARLKRQPVQANSGLLDRVGLIDARNRRVGTYSKGMRQRLGLAQAMLGRPRLMLLDEPTTGLDPELRHAFYEILGELRRDGATVLLSSHALAELEGQVDRVVVMNRGRKVADGTLGLLRQLAAMRPRIRLRRRPHDGYDWSGWSEGPGGLIEIECGEEMLTDTLRQLPSDARDIEIVRPSLDDLYASFQREVR